MEYMRGGRRACAGRRRPVAFAGTLPLRGLHPYFMMELRPAGMLKCPVNINFAKVIVFIDGFAARLRRFPWRSGISAL